jgi:hypothetical protein
MATLNAIYKISADISNLQEGMSRAVKATESVATGLGTMSTTAQNAGRALGAAFSAAQVIGFARDDTASFAEEEAALQKLTTALMAQGNATPQVVADFARMAEVFQKTTTFSDELVVEMQALLVQVGNVAPAQMQAALTAATNLSSGLGVDLRTATMLVGKAFEGETGTLKRYGIVIDEAKLKGEGITAVLDAINGKFGGQASAAVETHTGKMKQFANQIDEVKERVGNAIATVLSPLLTLFLDLPAAAQSVVAVLGGLVSAAAPVVVAFTGIGGAWALIAPYLGPAGIIAAGITSWFVVFKNLDVFVWAAVTAWTNFKNRLSQTGTELVDVSKRTYEGIREWLLDKFGAVVTAIGDKVNAVSDFFKDMYQKVVGGSYVPDMIAGVGAEFAKLDGFMMTPAQVATNYVNGLFHDMSVKVQETVSGMLSGVGGMFGSFLQAVLPGFAGALMGGLADIAMKGLAWLGNKIWSGIKSIFGGGSGRGAVEDFAAGMGGFDALHQSMQDQFGDSDAERLWKQLTQTDKNGSQQAMQEIMDRMNGAGGFRATGGSVDGMDAPSGGSTTTTTNVHVNVDGREIANVTARQVYA